MSQHERAYYVADVAQFASSSTAAILGSLVANTEFDVELAQRNVQRAWDAR
jgi:hypothetical protein